MSKAIVGRLTATRDGSYPDYVTVTGPRGDVSYLPALKCDTRVVGYETSLMEIHECSACGKRAPMGMAPAFCPRCGAEVRGKPRASERKAR